MINKKENRKDVLLRACYDILQKASESPYVVNALELTAKYDGTVCDGYCLMDDIAIELGIEE